MTYENHPIAEIFPMMGGEDYKRLKDSIQAHGLIEPGVLFEGKLLDGRNRLKACLELGVDFGADDFDDEGGMTPLEFVVAANLSRRHLKPSQLSVVAAKVRDYQDEEAKKRQGKRTDIQENFPECDRGQARDKAAAAVGVSGRLVDHASKVLKDGDEKLIAAVESGEIAVTKASRIASLPKGEQIEIIEGTRQLPKKDKPTSKAKPPTPKVAPDASDRSTVVINYWAPVRSQLFAFAKTLNDTERGALTAMVNDAVNCISTNQF